MHRPLAPLLRLAAPAAALALAAPAGRAAAQLAAPPEPSTVITSYGELNLNRPRRASDAQADLRRFVLGLQHRFDERTKVVAEVEVEHAISSQSDQGEVEIEQAYVERQLGGTWSARGGLFLVPLGLLNESHEPTAYYGVERNFVETAIIPTTWREGGLQAVAAFGTGITLKLGATTSFDLNRWDATSAEGQESPLGAVHQELQLARAHDVAGHLAVDWRGVPGLLLGAAGFAGNGTQGAPGAPRGLIALWELHARWTPGPFDLSALLARGTIGDTARLNAPLVGNLSLVPAEFDGWYLQAAWRAWSRGDLVLAPFARYERFNTGRRYADLGPGLTPPARATQGVISVGANLGLAGGVVLKADLQAFQQDHGRDRLDLGLGWSF
jgi:hypothetical protein